MSEIISTTKCYCMYISDYFKDSTCFTDDIVLSPRKLGGTIMIITSPKTLIAIMYVILVTSYDGKNELIQVHYKKVPTAITA